MTWRESVAEFLAEQTGQLLVFVIAIEAREYGYCDKHHIVSDTEDTAILLAQETWGYDRRVSIHDVYPA